MVGLVVATSSRVAQPTPEELAKNPALFLESARKTLKWDEPAEPAKIVGPIYFVGTKGLSVFLIQTSEGHILLNTGMPGSGPMIEASIRKLGLKPEDIRILLTGHAHIDHVGGHAYLKKLSGATGRDDRRGEGPAGVGWQVRLLLRRTRCSGSSRPKWTIVFHDGDDIKLGDVTLKALLTNGHTKGSTTFLMKVVDGGKTYTRRVSLRHERQSGLSSREEPVPSRNRRRLPSHAPRSRRPAARYLAAAAQRHLCLRRQAQTFGERKGQRPGSIRRDTGSGRLAQRLKLDEADRERTSCGNDSPN